MTESIHSNLGLFVLILSALSLKLAARHYKLVGRNMVAKSQFAADDKQKQALKSFRLARRLMRKNEYVLAFNHLKAAEAFLAKADASKMSFLSILFAYQSVCIFHGGIGRAPYKESLDTAEKACNLAYLCQDDRAAYDALFARSRILSGLGENERAAADQEQALALGRRLFPRHSRTGDFPSETATLVSLFPKEKSKAIAQQ